MMIQLLKKDWRVYRVAILGNLVFILGIYAIAICAYLMEPGKGPSDRISDPLNSAAAGSIVITGMLAATFGASAFTIERRERSAAFLAALPVHRRKIIASKLIVPFAAIFSFIGLNVLVILFANWDTGLLQTGDGSAIGGAFAWVLFSFGVAWMLSTFMESAPLAFGITIGIIGGAFVFVTMYLHLFGKFEMSTQTINEIAAWLACMIGLISLLGGSIYYLRRIEP